MKIGYARVSTKKQNLKLQVDALKKAGCEKVYTDISNGSKFDRIELSKAMEFLRNGDTLIIWKLDRLGRNVKKLIQFVDELNSKNIKFISLTDSIDTSTSTGMFFFHIMASLSEMEKELISERTKAGLESAKKLGRYGGRKRSMTESKLNSAKKLLENGVCRKEVAKNLGVSIPTLYRWIPAS